MAKDLNSVNIIGRLTADPVTKQTQGGSNYSNFSIASNNFKGEGMFFNCTAFGKTSDVVSNYCKKGNRIAIEGELSQRSWQAQDGTKRSDVSINVRSVYLLESKKDNQSVENTFDGKEVSSAPPQMPDGFNPFDDSGIPM